MTSAVPAIAVDVGDVLRVEPEPLVHDLAEARLVALPLVLAAFARVVNEL
jgi:hypothetical protein